MSTITIEQGSGNVYADLGMADAQEMLECLARLGRDIDIVVKPARRRAVAGATGHVNVVFA